MTNAYYTPSGNPADDALGSSSAIRAEFALIEAGFDVLGVGQKFYIQVPFENFNSTTANWVQTPYAGVITTIDMATEVAVDATTVFTFSLGGVTITTSGIQLANSAAAGSSITQVVPSANNIVTAGQVIKMVSDGAQVASNSDAVILIGVTRT